MQQQVRTRIQVCKDDHTIDKQQLSFINTYVLGTACCCLGCPGSSLWRAGFLQLWRAGFSCSAAQALACRLSSCGSRAQLPDQGLDSCPLHCRRVLYRWATREARMSQITFCSFSSPPPPTPYVTVLPVNLIAILCHIFISLRNKNLISYFFFYWLIKSL